MEPPNENNKDISKGIGKIKIKKALKESYTLLKVIGNKKNAEKKDIRVKTNVKAYLEIGLERLTGSSNKQKITIKENMRTISLEEQQPTINQLPKINKVLQINHNNVDTNETLEQQVREMHQFINQLQGILSQDRANLLGPTNNLLFVHNQLFELELLKDNTMQGASTASQDIIDKLRSYSNRLDQFSQDFTKYLWELSGILIPLAKNGHASTTIANLVKIIEIEDGRARDSALETITNDARVIKSYKVNFLVQVNDSIIKSFDEKLKKYEKSPVQLLDKLEFIYDDLILVKDEIDPFFPSDYNILSFFVSEYHKNINKYIEELLKSEPNAGTILRLIRWVRHYYTFMEKKMYVSEDLMKPKLLNGREQALIDDYLCLMRSKFQEWKTNLIESDIKEFTQRQNQPELDSKNFAGLPGTPILISMVRQQIDLATESINYQLLNDVINECCEIMSEVQQTWINLLNSELRQHLDNQEESADGLVIYIIALANDQLGFADFIDILLRQFTSSLPEEYNKNITNVLNNIINGFSNVATNAINIILDIIYNDLKKPFRELHTARWYKRHTMAVIVETLKDYTEECHSHLKSDLFNKLMIAMLNRFVIAYIESMRNKAVKFRMPHCIDKMRQDIHSISDFFVEYVGAKELSSQLDVIDKLLNFLGTSQELVYLDYYSLRKAYGDIPRKYLKIILSKRDDLNLLAMTKINKTLKAKAAEAGEYDGEPTVFSKIIIEDLEGTSGDDLKGDIQGAFHRIRSLRLNKKITNKNLDITNIFSQ